MFSLWPQPGPRSRVRWARPPRKRRTDASRPRRFPCTTGTVTLNRTSEWYDSRAAPSEDLGYVDIRHLADRHEISDQPEVRHFHAAVPYFPHPLTGGAHGVFEVQTREFKLARAARMALLEVLREDPFDDICALICFKPAESPTDRGLA